MVCPGFRLLAEEPEWQAIQSSFQRQSPSLVRPQIGQGFALQLEVRWRIAAPGLTLQFCLWKGVGATLKIGFELLALAGYCPEFAAPPAAGVFLWAISFRPPVGYEGGLVEKTDEKHAAHLPHSSLLVKADQLENE